MALPITTNDLITETRNKLDEDNTASVSDAKILSALNRGARKAYMILAKQFDQMFMERASFTTDGTNQLDIPDEAFGRRVEFLTVLINNEEIPLDKLQPKKLARYNTNWKVNYPGYYSTRQGKIYLGPTPISGITGYIYYMRKPLSLVESQGRVVAISGDTVTVDTVGSDLATTVDNLAAFVNIVDPETGNAKTSMQLSAINTTTGLLTFKTSGLDRTTVYGATISSSLPSTITKDDYVCGIGGTCVWEFISDHSDYLIQFAVVDIKRALRLPVSEDFAHLKDLEREIETIWSGRETDAHVSNKNIHWSRTRLGRRRFRRR